MEAFDSAVEDSLEVAAAAAAAAVAVAAVEALFVPALVVREIVAVVEGAKLLQGLLHTDHRAVFGVAVHYQAAAAVAAENQLVGVGMVVQDVEALPLGA